MTDRRSFKTVANDLEKFNVLASHVEDAQTNRELERKTLDEQLSIVYRRQELERLTALRIANEHKPNLVTTLKCVVWFGYIVFLAQLILLWCCNDSIIYPEVLITSLIITGAVPTAVLLVSVRAIFSAEPSKIDPSPIATIASETTKNALQ